MEPPMKAGVGPETGIKGNLGPVDGAFWAYSYALKPATAPLKCDQGLGFHGLAQYLETQSLRSTRSATLRSLKAPAPGRLYHNT